MASQLHYTTNGDQNDLLASYIRKALMGEELSEPNQSQMNGVFEVAESIWYAHRNGGVSAVAQAWETIKRLRPDMAALPLNDEGLLIHADELHKLSKPFYILEEYAIYANGFNILSGPSGAGKSFVALDIAGKISLVAPVVYIAGEGLHGYRARWQAWKAYNDVDTGDLTFYREALQLMEKDKLESFIKLVLQHRPMLVVIDTLARSAIGMEENSAKEMGQFVGASDYLRAVLGCGVLVVHHTGKSGAIRGSTALYGAADSVLALSSSDGRITLTNNPDRGGKNKHSESARDKFFKIIPYPVKDDNTGEDLDGAVLAPAESVIQTKIDNLTSNQRSIMESIEGYEQGLKAEAISNATTIAQSTVYYNLKRLMKLGYVVIENEKYILTGEGGTALYA